MSKITAQELSLLRTQPHSTQLWLSIYQPTTVLACRVNDPAIAKGERNIIFDTVSSGSHLLVQPGMTMWVGSSAGSDDYGKIRVRSGTASTIHVAENDHIDWEDNLYLTVVSFYEINAVYPRIIQPDPEELEVIFYKDYDIEYTNQNSVLGSFVNMGPHYAGFLSGGSAQVYYSASGTVNLKGDALTYQWFFEGATVTGSTSQTPGYISYSSPGHYTTRLIVSNASGGQDISYRHVSIYNRPGEGTNVPFLKWRLDSLNGNREGGGYNGRIILRDTVGQNIVKDGSLVVIFAEDRYGGTARSIGGNAENRASIVFCGYVMDGTVEYNYAESLVEFEIGSPTEVLKVSEGFGISVESKAGPATWFELLDMDVRRAIYHFLRWHTTFLMTNDVSFRGTDYAIQFFDADRESLYDAIRSLIKNALVGSVVSDRQGKMWLEVDAYTDGSPALETTFTLDNQDWMEMPEVDQRQVNDLSFLEVGGIAYSGPVTGTFGAFLANAPGDAPAYRGKIERFQGLALASQEQLNALAGDIFAYRNSEFPSSSFLLAGNYRNFDIAPQENFLINLAPGDTVRNISFFGKNFLIQSVDWLYDPRDEFFNPRIVFVERTEGFSGDTIIIPDVPDLGGFGNTPPFQFPPLSIPPFGDNVQFLLYDEGVFQGIIQALDFQGSPVEATVPSPPIGTVTVTCDNTLTGNDSIGSSRNASTSFLLTQEEHEIGQGNNTYNNGWTVTTNKFTCNTTGVYFIGINGQFSIASLFLCANKGSDFGGTVKIKHYNSSNALIQEFEGVTGRLLCFESPSTATDVSIDEIGFSVTSTFSITAGDYLKFTFTPDFSAPSTAGTITNRYSIFRIT